MDQVQDHAVAPVGEGAEDQREAAPAFRGTHSHTIDGKGRVSLPSDYRKVLSETSVSSVIVTNYVSDGSRCLEGFHPIAWQKFENALKAKSRFDPRVQRLENFYLSRAVECGVDKNGRILLPQNLRSYAALEKEVAFSASIHGFRIWDKRVWDHIFAAAEAALLEDPTLFSDLDV